MTPPPTEYRILALYRFVPLVSLTEHTNTNSAGNDHDKKNNSDDDGDNDASTTANTILTHPERHPTLRNLQSELQTTLRRYDAKGTILIAPEGINGTICYPWTLRECDAGDDDEKKVEEGKEKEEEGEEDPVAEYLKTHPLFGGPNLRTRMSVWKDESSSDDDNDNEENPKQQPNKKKKQPQQAFHRLKIKIKAEIVTLGLGRPLIDRKPIEKEDEIIPHTNAPMNTSSSELRHASNQQANPLSTKGTYLSPTQWDEACRDPNILVIDTRNTYEIEIGTFESAIDPETSNFSDFPEYLERLAEEYDWSGVGSSNGNNGMREEENNTSGDLCENGSYDVEDDSRAATASSAIETTEGNEHRNINNTQGENKTKKKPLPPKGIAMFCTGGIRCEKATSYAIQSELFPKSLPIYHLEGGILAYLDDVAKRKEKEEDFFDGKQTQTEMDKEVLQRQQQQQTSSSSLSSKSTFHGECFVFDKRVAVTEGLKPSSNYINCHGCRGPMDQRLLLRDGTNNLDNPKNNTESALAVIRAYETLSKGISKSNLPPLQFDSKTQKHYLPGLTFPRCHASTTRESLERFAQRERQMEICAKEGRSHFEDRG